VPRRILPVPSSFPLASLIALARPVEPLGVWLEAARPPVRLVVPGPGGRRLVLLASDLATLLAVAARVAVWDGAALRTIAARSLGRARRLALRNGAGADDALAGAARGAPSPGLSRRAQRDVMLPQPIDCVVEGPVA
jgi:hypothetical protein